MIYSGADLIRSSGQSHDRLERLSTAEVREPAGASPGGDDEGGNSNGTQAALERFAKFIHKEGEKKKKPGLSLVPSKKSAGDPYRVARSHTSELFERGTLLDIHI